MTSTPDRQACAALPPLLLLPPLPLPLLLPLLLPLALLPLLLLPVAGSPKARLSAGDSMRW